MFKNLLIFILIESPLLQLYAQKAIPLAQAKEKGYDLTLLDSIHRSATHIDTSKAVFKELEMSEVFKHWRGLINQMVNYMSENNFEWKQNSRGFNRVYFNPDGSIKYFFYRIDKELFNTEEQAQFHKLLEEFIKDYRFTLSASEPFVQCGSVNYINTVSKKERGE